MTDLAEQAVFAERVRRTGLGTWPAALLSFSRRKPLGAVGAVLVVLLLLAAAFAPVLARYPYTQSHVKDRLQGPTSRYWLGTDQSGRDVYSRLLYGARVSVTIGFGAVAVSAVAATAIGLLCGYRGGWTDVLLQRVIDIWMAFPGLILLISLVAIFGASITTSTLVIGLLFAAGSSRVIRGEVLRVRSLQFVEAAAALGARDLRVILQHILPNVFPTVVVLATVQLGAAILVESSLSFLGYGVPPPAPSWGGMLAVEGRARFLQQPWLAVWPGLVIALAVYGFNMLGDALRDVLDPRLRGTGRRA